jgi:hypothetical protein
MEEFQELLDFIKRTAPKRSFPFVVRALEETLKNPEYLSVFLSPDQEDGPGTSTRSPSEKLPPGFDTEPVQVDHLELPSSEGDPSEQGLHAVDSPEEIREERR